MGTDTQTFTSINLDIPAGFNFLQLPRDSLPQLYSSNYPNCFLAGLQEGTLAAHHGVGDATSPMGQSSQPHMERGALGGGAFDLLLVSILRNLKTSLTGYYAAHETDRAPLSGKVFLEMIEQCDKQDGLEGYKFANPNIYRGLMNRMVREFQDAVERSRTGVAPAKASSTN